MKAATEAKQTEEKYDKRENKKQKRGKKMLFEWKIHARFGVRWTFYSVYETRFDDAFMTMALACSFSSIF